MIAKTELEKSFSIPGISNSHSDNIIHMADSIIDNDDIVPFTAQLGSYHANNLQGRRSHFVEECKDGGFVWDHRDKRYDCIGFNGRGVCSHTVAVVKYSGKFNAYMHYLDEKLPLKI